MRQTPAGKLLVRYGFEPYDTETSARRVAERAAEDVADLVKTLAILQRYIQKRPCFGSAATLYHIKDKINKFTK